MLFTHRRPGRFLQPHTANDVLFGNVLERFEIRGTGLRR